MTCASVNFTLANGGHMATAIQATPGATGTRSPTSTSTVTSGAAGLANIGRRFVHGDTGGAFDMADSFEHEALMMDAVRMIGGTMIGLAVLVVVLNQVFSLKSINNSTGAFSGVITSLKTTGGAALGLLVIGLLVVGANYVMGFFGGGGF